MSQVFEAVEKSPNDKREYRHVTLPNQLEALLIHDPDTVKSAAGCSVNVGSMSDPEVAQGLAHFLEHMLFLGTEEYPSENEYSVYLNNHGGYSNAYTAGENTVYYFDVQNEFFEGALDIFSAFFKCPLFTEEATGREMNAVDNENTKNLQSDGWRDYQLLKHHAKSDHPFSNFGTGNLETLKNVPESKGLSTRQLLLDFHKQFYSANIMKLVVYGREPLDVMQKWAEGKFSAIENKDVSVPSFSPDAYGPEQLCRIVEVVPVRDTKCLDINFPTPSVDPHYRSLPMRYISHLLGHEAEGSLLSYLKARGWANGLGSYSSKCFRELAAAGVSIDLTDEGVDHVEEIMEHVFAYIGILVKSGPMEWIAQEVKTEADNAFRFKQKNDPIDYVPTVAEAMHTYPKEHILSGGRVVYDIDLPAIAEFLSYLRPSNCLVFVKHKGFDGKTTLTEPWYGTAYNNNVISSDVLSRWEHSLASAKSNDDIIASIAAGGSAPYQLPTPNAFLPSDFSLRCESNGVSDSDAIDVADITLENRIKTARDISPKVLLNISGKTANEDATLPKCLGEVPSSALLVWYKPDSFWKVPKLNVVVRIETNVAYSSPKRLVLTELFSGVLKELLNEFTYYADCAGLRFSVSNTLLGFDISYFGYNHKLKVLVDETIRVMRKMCDTADGECCADDLFNRIKEKQSRDYYNHIFWQPYNHCVVNSSYCLEEPRWTVREKYQSILSLTLADLTLHCREFLSTNRLEVLVHGNATEDEAKLIAEDVRKELRCAPLPTACSTVRRGAVLEPGTEYVHRLSALDYNPNEQNSAIEMLLFTTRSPGAGDKAFPAPFEVANENDVVSASAMLELIQHIMSEPAFDQLRTKEQLGYIVSLSGKSVAQLECLRIIIQSNSSDPVFLEGRAEAFLESYRNDVIETMTEEFLAVNVAAVIENLLEPPKNIDKETMVMWNEISPAAYEFSRSVKLAERLMSVTVADIKAFFDKYIRVGSPRRVKFTSQFFGKDADISVKKDVIDGLKVVYIDDAVRFKRNVALRANRSYLEVALGDSA